MRNVFMLYMPPGNPEAMAHYRDTIQQRVSLERVARYLSRDQVSQLREIFGSRPIAVWGSREGTGNRAKFEKMSIGDDLLIVEGPTIRLMGKVASKVVSDDLSRELWRNINDGSTAGWPLIYFIANPQELAVPFARFCELMGYQSNYKLQGFSSVSADNLNSFYERYDDLYSVLQKLAHGQAISALPRIEERQVIDYKIEVPLEPEDIEQVLKAPLVTDHVRMQCKLLGLGLKAGSKVWVPVADQGKLLKACDHADFEKEFTAGIDLPRSVENIDVVWKEEFRIDAAFEVENSTAIYSGLLRFADLTILAPNTTYPMFIVAPVVRRNQVREQVLRPSFKRLGIREKVLFLPYEAVDDIDRFFKSSSAGLNVDVVRAKAEMLT